MKMSNQENLSPESSKCKCEERLKRRLADLDLKVGRVQLEIEKLHRLNQNRNTQQKENRPYQEINLLDLEMSLDKISTFKYLENQSSKLTNEVISSQFEYLHDEILDMKGRLNSITGIQSNLDIQALLTHQITERQHSTTQSLQRVLNTQIPSNNRRVNRLEEQGKALDIKISWIVEYLQKCGYKYINKIKTLS